MSLRRPGTRRPAIAVLVAMGSALGCFAPPASSAPELRLTKQSLAEAGRPTAPRLARADEGRKRDKASDRRREKPRAGSRSDERDDKRGQGRDDDRGYQRKQDSDDARKPPRAQGRGTEGRKDYRDENRGPRDGRSRDSGREQPGGSRSEVRISRDQAAAIARGAVGGRVLRVELSDSRYRVKLLVDGERVRTVQVDARTGQLR